LLSIQNEREWQRFCVEILVDADFAEQYPDNSSRLANRSVVDGCVETALGKLSHTEASAKLKKSEIAYSTLNDVQGLSSHPILRRAVISNPEGKINVPAPPAIFNDAPQDSLKEVPSLNQHGTVIRAEFSEN